MRVQERVIKAAKAGLTLRVWCKAENLRDHDEYERQRTAIVEAVAAADTTGMYAAVGVAEAVERLPFCSAVEVSDGPVRPAVIIYPEWP